MGAGKVVFKQRHAQIACLLRSNESVVLPGPKFIGKRFILSQVEKQLQEAGEGAIVTFRLLDGAFRKQHELGNWACRQLEHALGPHGRHNRKITWSCRTRCAISCARIGVTLLIGGEI